MTPEDWKKIEDIYHEALERPATERAAFLNEHCPPWLRDRVESLLGTAGRTEDFMSRPAIEVEAESMAREVPLSLPFLEKRYQLIEQVGRGGMGIVYKARDFETNDVIAIKLLNPGIATDPQVIERFRSELRISRRITHKNVCRMYDMNHSGNTSYISMEFIEGESLRRVLNRLGALTVRKGVELVQQICDGLQEAHDQGIIHRDLKPENLMVDQSGNVKIMDFGIARLMDSARITIAGGICGTPAYMSPEQASGRSADIRSDIYSLGLIMYEIFTARVAFTGETPIAIALKQTTETPVRPTVIEPSLPVELEKIILRCIEKDPQRRFQSLAELKAALHNQIPLSSTPVPRVENKVSTWFSESAYVLQPNPARALLLFVQAAYLFIYCSTLYYLEPAARVLEEELGLSANLGLRVLLFSALAGIALRMFLASAIALNHPETGVQFWRIFPTLLVLDELWAASPLLLANRIGIGLALAATAGMAYLPFSQKTLAHNAYRIR